MFKSTSCPSGNEEQRADSLGAPAAARGEESEVCEEQGGDGAPLSWDCWHRGTQPSPPALHAGSAEWSRSPQTSWPRTDHWSSLICPLHPRFGSKSKIPGLSPRSVSTNKGQYDQKWDHT